MIEITYSPEQFSVSVKGHAGAGEPGRDIVCAGVSALVYAMSERARERFGARCDDRESGSALVRCDPHPGDEALCREMLETGLTGLRAIAQTYPAYVTMREKRIAAAPTAPRNDRERTEAE